MDRVIQFGNLQDFARFSKNVTFEHCTKKLKISIDGLLYVRVNCCPSEETLEVAECTMITT